MRSRTAVRQILIYLVDFNSSNFGVKSNQLNEIIANEILCENNKSSNQEVEGTSEINNNQTTLGQPTTNRGFTNVVSNSNIDSTAINSLINTTSNMNANIASSIHPIENNIENNNHPNCPEEYHNLNVQDELNQNFQSLENMDYSAVLRNFDSQMDSLQDKIITLISSEK